MARKPLLLKNVSDAERGLAYTLTSNYLAANIREYINYLVSGAISQRYERTV